METYILNEQQNALFIDQPDGSALPTPYLLDRIRKNPERYPDAARDLADASGKTVGGG